MKFILPIFNIASGNCGATIVYFSPFIILGHNLLIITSLPDNGISCSPSFQQVLLTKKHITKGSAFS